MGLDVLAGLIAFGTINFIWAVLRDKSEVESN
jgi:hypothetical protein